MREAKSIFFAYEHIHICLEKNSIAVAYERLYAFSEVSNYFHRAKARITAVSSSKLKVETSNIFFLQFTRLIPQLVHVYLLVIFIRRKKTLFKSRTYLVFLKYVYTKI